MAERYEFVKAFVEDGNLRWEYRLRGKSVTGRQSHDEDVSEWSERDIIQLTRSMLDVESETQVEVIYQ